MISICLLPYCCLSAMVSKKMQVIVATCRRCPQKMRKLLPRVADVRKKCGSCCHVSTMCAKNAGAVATCRRYPQKMRELLPRVNDVRKKCADSCRTAMITSKKILWLLGEHKLHLKLADRARTSYCEKKNGWGWQYAFHLSLFFILKKAEEKFWLSFFFLNKFAKLFCHSGGK